MLNEIIAAIPDHLKTDKDLTPYPFDESVRTVCALHCAERIIIKFVIPRSEWKLGSEDDVPIMTQVAMEIDTLWWQGKYAVNITRQDSYDVSYNHNKVIYPTRSRFFDIAAERYPEFAEWLLFHPEWF